jgi:hypothetical protein
MIRLGERESWNKQDFCLADGASDCAPDLVLIAHLAVFGVREGKPDRLRAQDVARPDVFLTANPRGVLGRAEAARRVPLLGRPDASRVVREDRDDANAVPVARRPRDASAQRECRVVQMRREHGDLAVRENRSVPGRAHLAGSSVARGPFLAW